MEFAYLNATLRSAHFPPYDPWYADGYINYYYYGLYLVAFCLKLTGIPSEIGFNLAEPTVIALLASGAYTVAATLGRDITGRRKLAIPAGVVGTVLLVGMGNLALLRELLQENGAPTDRFWNWTWLPSRAISGAITEFPYFTALYADLHAHVVALPVTVISIALSYALARDRRLLAVALTRRGDAAARVIVGVRLGLLALVLGTLWASNAWDVPVYAALAGASLLMATGAIDGWRRKIGGLVGLGLPLTAGAYLLFLPFTQHYVALFGSLARVRAPTPFGEEASHLGGLLAIVIIGLVVVLLPWRTRLSPALSQPIIPVLAVLGLVFARERAPSSDTRLGVALGIGIVVVTAVVLGLAALAAMRDAKRRGRAMRTWSLAVFTLDVAAVALALLSDRVVLAGFLAVGGAALALWLTADTVGARFVGLMVTAACGVGAGTELVVLADDLINTDSYRMNTIFKFYNQIWVLLALSGGVLIAKMIVEAGLPSWPRPTLRGGTSTSLGIVRGVDRFPADEAKERSQLTSGAVRARWSRAGVGVSIVVFAASFLYPVFATMPRLEQRFAPQLGSGTLNALDWMRYGSLPALGNGAADQLSFAGDRAAINWLNHNVQGSPVIAEASIGPYRCNGSRISTGTGLPTIIGWEHHEAQQRYPETLAGRVDDVGRLYATSDPAEKLAILHRYNVEYVVVGDLERLYPVSNNECTPSGSAAGIAAFDQMVGSSLDVAFAAEGTTIYRVRPVGGG